MKNDGTGKECFQSLFCHWCQTCYFQEWQLLKWSKYYHLVDWQGGVNQQDVTRAPRERLKLWCCNEVQGSAKTLMK